MRMALVAGLGLVCLAACSPKAADKPAEAVALAPAAAPAEDPKSPKAVVEAFNKLAFEEHKPIEATLKYIAPDVIEHDVNTPGGGREPILEFMRKRDWTNSKMKAEVKRVIAEGDLVVVHHHVTDGPDDLGMAFVDIFRVKDGLIVEHWDVAQKVPKPTVNPHGMF
jgi:predicted SnoaL-like aldol condensation-catalyzing enzyme